MTQNKNSRRHFLGQGLAFGAVGLLSPHQMFLNSLCRGLIQDAQAAENNTGSAMNYVSMDVVGAPLRFTFDQWLRVYDDDPQILFNPMAATKFKTKNPSGRNAAQAANDLEYATFKYKGMNAPYLFSQMINTSQGAVSLSQLLDHMLMVRGFASGIDGHQINATKMTLPVGGISSIAGLNADQQKRTFDAVQWPDRNIRSAFYSEKGRSLIALRGGAPLNDLLNSFKRQTAAAEMHKLQDTRKSSMDLAIERLSAYAKSSSAGASRLKSDFANAKKLIQGGLADFNSFYNANVQKYRSVVLGAIRTLDIEGISDFQLISPLTNFEAGPWSITLDTDLNSALRTGFDFRQALASAEMHLLAESLTVAEFLITQKLCSSIELQIAGSMALEMPYINDQGTVFGSKKTAATHDMHSTGAYLSLPITNAIYRGILAGIYEFSNALKNTVDSDNKNMWEKTVVHLFSEFGRSTRSNASGSDHGYNSMATSFFTGAVTDGPHVMGNIRVGGINASDYTGTQGLAAPIPGHNEPLPSPIAVASTLTQLLKTDRNPYNNLAWPLGKFENGKWVVTQKAKLVGG